MWHHDPRSRASQFRIERFLNHIGRGFLAYKEYFGFGGELADSACGFDSIQRRKPDVEHNQVRLQSFGFLNRFQSVRCFVDDLQFRLTLERR